MYNIGDRVVLVYPERSKWSGTMKAVTIGILKVGAIYTVIGNDKISGICLDVQNPYTRGKGWYLTEEALELYRPKNKRNLPEWF